MFFSTFCCFCQVEVGTKADMWALGVVTWDCYARTHRSLFVPDPKFLVKDTQNLEQALGRFHTVWTERALDMQLSEDDIAGPIFRRTFRLEKDRYSAADLYRDLQGSMSKTLRTLEED